MVKSDLVRSRTRKDSKASSKGLSKFDYPGYRGDPKQPRAAIGAERTDRASTVEQRAHGIARSCPQEGQLRHMGGGAVPLQGYDYERLPAHRPAGREEGGHQGPGRAAHRHDGLHEGARPACQDRTDHHHYGPN
eukprot:scaffold63892_cov75-Phaeocystis_antarctica.AAC.8